MFTRGKVVQQGSTGVFAEPISTMFHPARLTEHAEKIVDWHAKEAPSEWCFSTVQAASESDFSGGSFRKGEVREFPRTLGINIMQLLYLSVAKAFWPPSKASTISRNNFQNLSSTFIGIGSHCMVHIAILSAAQHRPRFVAFTALHLFIPATKYIRRCIHVS
jgi:hypothetical protein